MKILCACEESQAVTIELRKLGHDAYSCDLQPESGGYPEWHIQGNVLEIINEGWDLMIAHPPCTFLSNSGVTHLHTDKSRWAKLDSGAAFFKTLMECDIEMIAIENPIPHKYAIERIGKVYSQIIHPWEHGHLEQKQTCLWLKNLPPIKPTNIVYDEMMELPDNERQRLHYLPPGPDRGKERSKTFPGIAKALAQQLTCLDEADYYYKFNQASLL